MLKRAMRVVGWLALVAASVSFVGTSSADTVVMKNGDQLTGDLDSIKAGRLVLLTAYAGQLTIQLDQVATLQTDEDFQLRLVGSQRSGRFVAREGQQYLSDDADQLLALQNITLADQHRVAATDLVRQLDSRVDVALASSHGNSTARSYNTLIESQFLHGQNSHMLTFMLAREEGNGVTTKDLLDLDYGYKRYKAKGWYGAANGEYYQDPLKDIKPRISLGIGTGYQFVLSNLKKLSAEVGISAVQENLAGEESLSGAVRLALDYQQYFWSKRLELFHRNSLLSILESGRGEVCR